VVVAGRLWGTIIAATSRSEPLPVQTESRIAQFTDLVATAIANAEARGELLRLVEEQAAPRAGATPRAPQRAAGGPFVPGAEAAGAAVVEAVGSILGADLAVMAVFSDALSAKVVASWSQEGQAVPAGTSVPLDEDGVIARVYHAAASARMDRHVRGATPEIAR